MRPQDRRSIQELPALAGAYARATDEAARQALEPTVAEVVARAAERKASPWPEDAAERIAKHLAALEAEEPGSWPARVCRDQLGALPLWGRGIDLWALRPDGRVLWLDLDSAAHRSEVETDPLTIFAAMVHGAQAYPDLADVIPRPQPGYRICRECAGTGSGKASSCLSCSGLGWTG